MNSTLPTREQVFYDLCKNLHSVVEVKGTIAGFRTRLSRNNFGYKSQITLAPVSIAGVWVDHMNVDITTKLASMMCQEGIVIGHHVVLHGKLKLYQQFRYRIYAPSIRKL